MAAMAYGYLSCLPQAHSAPSRSKHLVVVDSRFAELEKRPCFTDWIFQLMGPGQPEVEVSFQDPRSVNPQASKTVRDKIASSGATTVTVIGSDFWSSINFTSNMEVEFDKNGVHHVVRKEVSPASTLPFMNPTSGKPESWTKPEKVREFFEHLDVSVGVIPPVYPDLAKKLPIDQVCDYLKKVTEYKKCIIKQTKEPSFIYYIEDDWNAKAQPQAQATATFYSNPNLYPTKGYSLLDVLEKSSQKKLGEASYDFCQLSVHAHAEGLSDYINQRAVIYSLTPEEVIKRDPHVRFYNLFACSAAAPLADGKANVAQALLFGSQKTVGLVASTKTGSLSYPEKFYLLFKHQHLPIGESAQRYLKEFLSRSNDLETDLGNHAGIVVLGDPTLTLTGCRK